MPSAIVTLGAYNTLATAIKNYDYERIRVLLGPSLLQFALRLRSRLEPTYAGCSVDTLIRPTREIKSNVQ